MSITNDTNQNRFMLNPFLEEQQREQSDERSLLPSSFSSQQQQKSGSHNKNNNNNKKNNIPNTPLPRSFAAVVAGRNNNNNNNNNAELPTNSKLEANNTGSTKLNFLKAVSGNNNNNNNNNNQTTHQKSAPRPATDLSQHNEQETVLGDEQEEHQEAFHGTNKMQSPHHRHTPNHHHATSHNHFNSDHRHHECDGGMGLKEASHVSLPDSPDAHEYQPLCPCVDCQTLFCDHTNYSYMMTYVQRHLPWEQSIRDQFGGYDDEDNEGDAFIRTSAWDAVVAKVTSAMMMENNSQILGRRRHDGGGNNDGEEIRLVRDHRSGTILRVDRDATFPCTFYMHLHTMKNMTAKTRNFSYNAFTRDRNPKVLKARAEVLENVLTVFDYSSNNHHNPNRKGFDDKENANHPQQGHSLIRATSFSNQSSRQLTPKLGSSSSTANSSVHLQHQNAPSHHPHQLHHQGQNENNDDGVTAAAETSSSSFQLPLSQHEHEKDQEAGVGRVEHDHHYDAHVAVTAGKAAAANAKDLLRPGQRLQSGRKLYELRHRFPERYYRPGYPHHDRPQQQLGVSNNSFNNNNNNNNYRTHGTTAIATITTTSTTTSNQNNNYSNIHNNNNGQGAAFLPPPPPAHHGNFFNYDGNQPHQMMNSQNYSNYYPDASNNYYYYNNNNNNNNHQTGQQQQQMNNTYYGGSPSYYQSQIQSNGNQQQYYAGYNNYNSNYSGGGGVPSYYQQ